MNPKKGTAWLTLLAAISFLWFPLLLLGNQPTDNQGNTAQGSDPAKPVREYTNKAANAVCLKCHSKTHIEFKAEGQEKVFKQKMFQECIIDTNLFYNANHWNFACTDCHSPDYSTFPHKGELRFEPKANCLDCHGDNPDYAQFKFEQIEEEFKKSVHFQKQGGSFTCWSCHDGHYYKINARNRKDDILAAIQYDNAICLSCHANTDKYQLITNKVNPNILVKHEWLPNQPNHFKHVRCVECHGEQNDSIMVSHNVQPKSKAVKKCAVCHSGNSKLMASLYKYQLENQGKFKLGDVGFMDEPVIIGGKRNSLVKTLGNIALVLTLLVIIFHGSLRYFTRKKHQS